MNRETFKAEYRSARKILAFKRAVASKVAVDFVQLARPLLSYEALLAACRGCDPLSLKYWRHEGVRQRKLHLFSWRKRPHLPGGRI